DPQQVTAISDRYTEEFKKRATVRERVTVTEHLTFLATILDARGAESAKIAEALRNIKRALEQTI
ncbi:MAG: hypothetical protein KDE58_14850, partial [Caldilineaceae bacterium]|nr:hypothetical protein [Caldilineaceae bacterium]